MKEIEKYLTDPNEPWRRGKIIQGAGLFAAGWTSESNVFLLFTDYYIVADSRTGERLIINEEDNLIKKLSKDNLEFFITELNETIKVFGLRGGNGNHYSSDRWNLIEIYSENQEKFIGLADYRNFGRSEKIYWRNYDIIEMKDLEYCQWSGFSPNEKYIGIFGSSGVEIIERD